MSGCDCCSPEVEKDDGFFWFLIKVLFLKLFILVIISPHLFSILLIINFLHTTIFLFSFVTFLPKVLWSVDRHRLPCSPYHRQAI